MRPTKQSVHKRANNLTRSEDSNALPLSAGFVYTVVDSDGEPISEEVAYFGDRSGENEQPEPGSQ